MGMPLLKVHCTECGKEIFVDMASYETMHENRRKEAVAIAEDHLYVQLMDSLGLAERPADIKDAIDNALKQAANEEKHRADKLEQHIRELTTDLNKTVIPATRLVTTNIATS